MTRKQAKEMTVPPVPHYSEDHNNPSWMMPVIVEIARMDNSLSMDQEIATFKTPTLTGSICHPLGGIALTVHITEKRTGAFRHYAIYCRPLVDLVLKHDEQFKKVAKKPHPFTLRKKRASKKSKRGG